MTIDFLTIVLMSVNRIFAEVRMLGLYAIIALILAIVCGYSCHVFARLWNRRFHHRLIHHLVCGFSATVMFLFVLIFFGTGHIGETCLTVIDDLEAQIHLDSGWSAAIYAQAYQKVKELGVENFSGFAPPGVDGSRIPTRHDASRRAVATLYANEARRYFMQEHPFLSKVAQLGAELPAETIFTDVRSVQDTMDDYPLERAINLAIRQLKDGLTKRISRVVFIVRATVLVLFLVLQSVAWGFIGWAACREIRPVI
jgi:hypothetical protein